MSGSQKCLVESALVLLCAFAAIVLPAVVLGTSNDGFQACRLSHHLAVRRRVGTAIIGSSELDRPGLAA